MNAEKQRVNVVNSVIIVPHLGITMRVLLGAALESWADAKPGESRAFAVRYKTKEIATLNVKQHDPPGDTSWSDQLNQSQSENALAV